MPLLGAELPMCTPVTGRTPIEIQIETQNQRFRGDRHLFGGSKGGAQSGPGRAAKCKGLERGCALGNYVSRVSDQYYRCGADSESYLSMVSFSLFIFNLLPLPYADGSQLLRALLEYYPSKREPTLNQRTMQATLSDHNNMAIRQYELNSDDEDFSDEGHGDREETWKRRVRRSVEGVVVSILVVWAAGWAMLALLRSS